MRRRIKRRRDANLEAGWEKRSRKSDWGAYVWLLAVVLVLAVAGMVVWLRPDERPARAGTAHGADELRGGLVAAEQVARAFLAESDPAKRLQWVRNANAVKTRLAQYPEEARSEVGEIEKVLGHQQDGKRSVTGFVVAFPSGNLRLLEVVGTPDGPRIDWDAYARHGTASWEDLWSGQANQAVVRVFCEPSTERPEPFEDQGKWTCFRMSSPDIPHTALAFAQVGSVREARMKQVVLNAPNYRQRFTLEIARHEGKGEPLFEIIRCVAVGWLEDDMPVEQAWKNASESYTAVHQDL